MYIKYNLVIGRKRSLEEISKEQVCNQEPPRIIFKTHKSDDRDTTLKTESLNVNSNHSLNNSFIPPTKNLSLFDVYFF